jgi:hypothetical protein
VDLSRARVVLRQRSMLDVLDLSLRFVVAHASSYAKITASLVVPAALVSFELASNLGWVWGWIGTVLLALLVQAPFTVLASRLVFDDEVSVRDVLLASLRALPRLFALRVVQLTVMIFGLVFFVVPGLWMGILLMFVAEAAILERATVRTAISRSLRIVGGQSGQAGSAALALLLLHTAAIFLGDDVGRFVVGGLFQFREPQAIWTVGGSPLALIGFWLFLPYSATARFFVYLDLRTRSEGWDIQTRFAAIALRAQEKRAAA